MQQSRQTSILATVAVMVCLCLVCVGVLAYIKLVRRPAQELAQYQARYGDIVAKTQAIVDARLQAQRDALAVARVAIPPDAPIPFSWDFHDALFKAWLEVEEATLSDLADVVLPRGWGNDPDSDRHLSNVEERLRTARQAGKITALETQFDPNQHGRDAALDHFRQYLLTAPFLDAMEAAIDLGVCRYVPPKAFSLHDGFRDKRDLAARLLAARAVLLAQRGDQEAALKTCLRLQQLAADDAQILGAYAVQGYPLDRYPLCRTADYALARVISAGPVSPEWKKRLLDSVAWRGDAGMAKEALEMSAVLSSPVLSVWQNEVGAVDQLGLYRAYETAETLSGLLSRPLFQSEDQLKAVQQEFDLYLLDRSLPARRAENSFPEMWNALLGGIHDTMASQIAFDLVLMCRGFARDSLTPDLLNVAFAIADYRAATGHSPSTLDQLIPNWLESVPLDPVSAVPITYETDGKGYRLKAPCDTVNARLDTMWSVE